MAAIDNLKTMVIKLQNTVDQLVIPADNEADIQAAADSISTSIETLQNKVNPS